MNDLTVPKRGRPKKVINEVLEPKEIKKILGRPKNIVKTTTEEPLKYEPSRGRPKLPEELKIRRDLDEYRKSYYKQNKEKYLSMIDCECCKKSFSIVNQYRHNRSKMHLRNLNVEIKTV